MAGTARRRGTRPKGDMTPYWDVSNHKPFVSCIQKKKDNLAVSFLSVPDDRHRVKLHPLLGDPNSDYINANYIDVSLILFSASVWHGMQIVTLTHTPRNATVYPFHSFKLTGLLAHFHLEPFIQSNSLTVGVLPDAMLSIAALNAWPRLTQLPLLLKRSGMNAFNARGGDEPFCKMPQIPLN